jgi:vacuolar-type H+-ATPase subunit I/STV1
VAWNELNLELALAGAVSERADGIRRRLSSSGKMLVRRALFGGEDSVVVGKSQSEGGVEASSITAGVGARMAEVQEKAQMRGQRLNEAEERSSQLAEAAGEYSSLAARLAKKQEQKNRWPFLG